MIIVDTREKEDFVRTLQSVVGVIHREKLDWGDVQIRTDNIDHITFERKTILDFYASLKDGRYDEQMPAFIKFNIHRPVLVIIGRLQELKEIMPLFNDMVFFGAIGSLFVKYGMEVMIFENDIQFAKFLSNINMRIEKGEKWNSRQKVDLSHPIISKIQFLTNIPYITPDIAIQLLVHFGSIKAIAQASQEELRQIPFIGEKRAKQIYNLFTQDVKEFFGGK